MSSIARRRRRTLTVAIACIGVAVISVPVARAQDLSGAERRKMEDMLRGVRTQIETYYYDSRESCWSWWVS